MRQLFQTSVKSRLRLGAGRAGQALLGGFALGVLSLGSRTLPLAACLCAPLGGVSALCAVLGAVLGYFLAFPFLQALEPAACAVMLYCLTRILAKSELPASRRNLLVLSAGATFSVGLIYAVGEGVGAMLWLLLRCILAALACSFYCRLLRVREDELEPRRAMETARALRGAGELLLREARGQDEGPVRRLYDQVTEQVCLRCPGYHRCFEQEAAATYAALRGAAERFLRRGTAEAGDFPQSFLAACRRPEALLRGVNHQMKACLQERQALVRRTEYQRVLGEHYRILSQLVLQEPPGPGELANFRAELGVQSASRRGSRISGDRGACFRCGQELFLLLCDGMGTGPEAAREARTAISLLSGFLRAGASPEDALDLLGGVYLLRESVCFSTVDLLRLDMASGTGELYKWGAAPSFLISQGKIQKMGTASPPPGLEGRWTPGPARLRLSLCRGEKLVLLSDGMESGQAMERLEALRELPPQRLASNLVGRPSGSGEDDLSAVVLRLHAVPA